MKIKRIFILPFSLLSVITCCELQPLKQISFNGETQGTYYSVTYFSEQEVSLQIEIDSMLHVFDQSVSMWVPNSIISRINRNDTTAKPDAIFAYLFNKSGEISEETGGAFDITVGPLVNAWGFGYSDRMKVNQGIIDSLMRFVGYHGIAIKDGEVVKSDPGIQIDFNAIAQGYAVDLLGSFLEKQGISNYLIDIGGEVLAKGTKPGRKKWRVGIEKPTLHEDDPRELKATIGITDAAIATSGNYRKFYEENGIRYSHTIDPATGYPVTHSLLSVSVLAEDCCTADAYATAFMVLGFDKAQDILARRKDLDAYFIYSDKNGEMQTYMTKGIRKLLISEE